MATLSLSPARGNDRKRKRLTFACNTCRHRKIRCDDRQPSCSNCHRTGIECLTTDPRYPGRAVERKEAQYRDSESPIISTRSGSIQSNTREQVGSISSPRHPADKDIRLERSDTNGELIEGSRLSTPILATTVAKTPLPVLPRFMSGNSLQVLTQWLDLAFARIGVSKRIPKRYMIDPFARRPSKFSPLLGLSSIHPRISFNVKTCAESFLSSVNMTYPIFEAGVVFELVQNYADGLTYEGSSLEMSSSSAMSMLLVAIAGNPNVDREAHDSIGQIRAAYSLLSVVVAEASLRSVQALFLMTIVFRGHNEIETAWHLIVLAVTIAQSLGIHRAFSARHRLNIGNTLSEEYVRTWWATYSLEKILSLETERPSSILDSECNQSVPVLDQNPPVFESLIKLARVQSRVNERSVKARSSEEDPRVEYKDVIREKLVNSGELDRMLVTWAEDLPSDLRPSNYRYCDPKQLQSVSFLAIQYHQTLVLLHRNSLLVNMQQARNEIDLYCSDKPYLPRMRRGQTICGDAARSIISTLDNVYETRMDSILNTINAPLIATYALAIHSLKHPNSGLAKADLELQARAIQLVHKQQTSVQDYDVKLADLLDALQSQVTAMVEGANSKKRPTHTILTQPPIPNSERSKHTQYFSKPAQQLPDQGDWQSSTADQAPNMFEISSDHTSQLLYDPTAWRDLFDQNFAFPNDGVDLAEVDWDAVAVAFDLPS